MLKLAFILASALVSVVIGGVGGLLFFEFAPSRCAGQYACGYGKAVIGMMVGLGVALLCFVGLLLKGLRKAKPPTTILQSPHSPADRQP
ncbi:hypothetical protein [Comamonas sp. HJ-2]